MRLNKRHFENDISFVPLGVFHATEFIEKILIFVLTLKHITIALLRKIANVNSTVYQ